MISRDYPESEHLYKLQFDHSLEGILVTSSDGSVVDANPAACRMLGMTKKELISKNCSDITDQTDPRIEEAITVRNEASQFRGKLNFLHKSGKIIPAECSSYMYKNNTGEIQNIINIQDISDRQSIEQQLLKEKLFTDSALNSIPGVFYVANEQGQVIRWNNNAIISSGYSPEEITNMNVLDFIHPEDRSAAQKSIEKVFKGEPASLEARLLKKGGEAVDYFFQGHQFCDGKKRYMVGCGLDISEQIKTRQTVNRTLYEKEILIREIHHRVKNNMALITSLLELQIDEAPDEQLEKLLKPAKLRIYAIAKIHEVLYQHEDFSQIPFHIYLKELIHSFKDNTEYKNLAKLELYSEEISLNVNQAVTLGLLINELVAKFNDIPVNREQPHALELNLTKKQSQVCLKIQAGHPHAASSGLFRQDSSTLNDILILTLVKQLDATFDFSNPRDEIQSLSVTFRREHKKGSISNLDF